MVVIVDVIVHASLELFKAVWRCKMEVLGLESAEEALNAGVLRRTARLDQEVLDAVLLGSCQECPASELRSVVSSHGLG